MMHEKLFESAIKDMEDGSLRMLITDCELRIGSSMRHEEPDMHYVNKQIGIANLAEKELASRI